jgi:deoxyhypusine synthase
VSKDTAVPGEYPPSAVEDGRAAAVARHAGAGAGAQHEAPSGGRMLWPQYGVTPDAGTYGVAAGLREGGTVTALHAAAGVGTIEPVQVNPTASISGVLDKLTAAGGQGRTLGRALMQWEKLTRDGDATIALALSTPVIAEGMREQLVYAVEHRFVDAVVATEADLFADLAEALGYAHAETAEGAAMSEEGREATQAYFARFLASAEAAPLAGSDLWRALGEALASTAPRKGLLQAAAAAEVRVFATGPSDGPLAAALRSAQAADSRVPPAPARDLLALARLLAARPRLGVVRIGEGTADALVAQARETAGLGDLPATTLVGSLTIGATRPFAPGDGHVVVAAEASLTLPLLITGLAQRVPGYRRTPPRRLVEFEPAAALA